MAWIINFGIVARAFSFFTISRFLKENDAPQIISVSSHGFPQLNIWASR